MLDQLTQLGLSGMAQAFAEIDASGDGAALTHADWLGLLVDREVTHRRDKRLAARLRYARLRHNAVVEDVDYRAPRGLDRALFHKLTGGEWIDAHDNLILCGPTGVGKSWLACALGHKACRNNRSVLYQRVPKLFTDLALARGGSGCLTIGVHFRLPPSSRPCCAINRDGLWHRIADLLRRFTAKECANYFTAVG